MRSSGRTGTRVSALPVAARSAASTAAVEAIVGGSPTPLSPYGASGCASSRISARTWISSISARPTPCAIPPSIWPCTESGLSALPTSCAVAISTTRTRPSSTSTSTTARWAAKANARCASPCPSSPSGTVRRGRYSRISSTGSSSRFATASTGEPASSTTCPASSRSDPAGEPGLARGRGGAGVADGRVGRKHHDVLDAQLRARDLRVDRDAALADLAGRRVDLHQRLAARAPRPAHAGGRVVVEAVREADVLEADRVADAAAGAFTARRVAEAARQPELAAGRDIRRQRHPLQALEQLGDGRGALDPLGGRQLRAALHRVAAAQLDGVHTERGGELVHLRLVGEAGLH